MSDRSRRTLLLAMVISPLFIGLLVLDRHLEWLEHAALDTLFEVRGVRQPRAPILIVALDQDTFDQLGQSWPLPRAMQAQVIEKLSAAGPLVIGIDFLFAGPSARGPEDDKALSAALSSARNVVLASSPIADSIDPRRGVRIVRPLPEFEAAAAAVGPTTIVFDPDGSVRRGVVRDESTGTPILSFAAHIARLGAGAHVGAAQRSEASPILINFRGGPRTYSWIPYHQVIRNEVPDEMIRGRIVLMGSIDPLDHDFFATPFASNRQMPGVEVQANLIETVLTGNPIREVPPLISLMVAMGVTGLATGFAVLPVGRALVASGSVLLVTCTGSFALFALGDIWFRSVGTILGILLGFGCALVLKARACQ